MSNTTEVLYIFRHNFYKLAVKVMGRWQKCNEETTFTTKKKKKIDFCFVPFSGYCLEVAAYMSQNLVPSCLRAPKHGSLEEFTHHKPPQQHVPSLFFAMWSSKQAPQVSPLLRPHKIPGNGIFMCWQSKEVERYVLSS